MRWVLKTASVRVATREKEDVYRSIEDVPTDLRAEIQEVFAGPNSKTIFIANQEAYERIKEHHSSKFGTDAREEPGLPPATGRPGGGWRLALAAALSTMSALALLWLWLILVGKS